ncbi:hypothetical protein SDC9_57899 [bioreactor metagenome]|uniref:DUF2577 domain-containing protein n=1 Tax=bioreactor metagenome TaxID=1076179 RepID=A0A644XBJ7_9ZZZZ
MEDDPFFKLAELFSGKTNGGGTGSGMQLGKVLSAPSAEEPDTPLKVSVSGTIQEAEDLLKNDALAALDFAAGDSVLLLPIDEAQRYIMICKVVSA